MALASYYRRTSTAASQIGGFGDERAFLEVLKTAGVGIHFTKTEALRAEGRLILDLLVRLFARLYPRLFLTGDSGTDGLLGELAALATDINPAIELAERPRDSWTVVVGEPNHPISGSVVYAGSKSWVGLVSRHQPHATGGTNNPLGPGAAACAAAGVVFNGLFLGQEIADDVIFSTLLSHSPADAGSVDLSPFALAPDTALVGLGGVGNALVWALARMPASGHVWLVDPEAIDLGNLQRYVLAGRKDVRRKKSRVALATLRSGTVSGHPYIGSWEEFAGDRGYKWDDVVVSVDSAAGRRHVQSSLPRWIANAWTQETEAAISVHPQFGGEGACLNCLYVRDTTGQSEDQRVMEALGLSSRLMEVRRLLVTNEGVAKDLLIEVAAHLGVPWSKVEPFLGRPLRQLYSDGVCGRAILPIGTTATTEKQDAHVPLAHQSALAGILLASALAMHRLRLNCHLGHVSRTDVIRQPFKLLTYPVRARTDGLCICNDADYRSIYRQKYAM